MWIQTVLLCGKHCKTMLIGTVSRLRFLQEILRTQNPLLEEHCAFFRSHTFVPISWMCKKQTSVSHSSTESEIISLDAGLRMDEIPALDLWILEIEVLHSSKNTHPAVRDHCRNKKVDDQVPTSPGRSEIQSTNHIIKSKSNSKREVAGVCNTYIKQYETGVERRDRWSSARKPSTRWNPKQKSPNLVEKKRWPRCWWSVKCGSRCHKRNFFSTWSSVVYIRRQRSCDEDDHQRQKPDDETRFQNPQSVLPIAFVPHSVSASSRGVLCQFSATLMGMAFPSFWNVLPFPFREPGSSCLSLLSGLLSVWSLAPLCPPTRQKAFAFCSPEQDPLSPGPSSFPPEPFSSSPRMTGAVLTPTHSTLMRSTFPWPCLVNVHNLQLAL